MNSHMGPSRGEPVVLSYALYGNAKSQECMLNNALQFTVAPLVVHLSYGTDRGFRKTLLRHHRVLLNNHSLHVQRLTPGVLSAHLSNLDACEAAGICDDASHLVLCAGNQMWIRPGIEAWVRERSVSFCSDKNCADLPCEDGLTSGRCLARARSLSWPVDDAAPATQLATSMRAVTSSGNDSAIAADPWIGMFVKRMRARAPEDSWRSAPLAFDTHEGSFYPVKLLREFRSRALAGSDFKRAMDGFQSKHSRCPCCELYGVDATKVCQGTRGDCYATGGSCAFEELLLPTYLWQRHPRLLQRASPPAVLRIWAQKSFAMTRTGAAVVGGASSAKVQDAIRELVGALRGDAATWPHIFALKIPHMLCGHASLVLYESPAPPPPSPGRPPSIFG